MVRKECSVLSSNVKVIINGFGSVGRGVLHTLLYHKGVELVGVMDMNPALVGKDAGEVIGGAPLGVLITNDKNLYATVKADVAIQAANSRTAQATFEQMRFALENGINVIVSNTPTSNLWVSNPELAKEIHDVCVSHNVSYCGFGASQIEERMLLAMTEGINNIKKITFTHFADVSAFSAESNALDLGVGIDYDVWRQRKASGDLVDRTEYKDNLTYVGEKLGWKFDEATFSSIPQVDDKNYVYGLTEKVAGIINGQEVLVMQHMFVLDPDKRYFDSYDIEGTPALHSVLNWTPDRGLASTYTALVNAIPNVIKAPAGYISSHDIPLINLTNASFSEVVRK